MSGKSWRLTGFLLTIIGFFIPFFVAKCVAMPMGRHPVVTALWGILWLAAFYCLYRAHEASESYPSSFALWKKVAIYIKDYTSYFLILSSLSAANFSPTGIAWKLPEQQMTFVSLTLLIMGMAIPVDEWKRIFKKPKPIFQIWAVRWICMPLISLVLAYLIFNSLISDPKMAKTLIAAQVLVERPPPVELPTSIPFLLEGTRRLPSWQRLSALLPIRCCSRRLRVASSARS